MSKRFYISSKNNQGLPYSDHTSDNVVTSFDCIDSDFDMLQNPKHIQDYYPRADYQCFKIEPTHNIQTKPTHLRATHSQYTVRLIP